jgi:hypothetical protein
MKMMTKTKQTKETHQQPGQAEEGVGEIIVEQDVGAVVQPYNHRNLPINHNSNRKGQYSNINNSSSSNNNNNNNFRVEKVMLLWAWEREVVQRARTVPTTVQVPFLLVWSLLVQSHQGLKHPC